MTAPSQPLAISRRPLDFEDYIDIARRHSAWIIGPLYAGIVISTIIAFLLPNVYLSRAMLRITPPEVNDTVAPVTSNRVLADRINTMWQDAVSHDSLAELIQRPALQLYQPARNRIPLEDVIDDMRNKDIHMDVVSSPQPNGKQSSAFVISFSYPDRFKAQAVVSALVTRLTDANQREKHKSDAVTVQMMNEEVEAAKGALQNLDQDLTAFRIANPGGLPEQIQSNASAIGSLQARLAALGDALDRNSQEKMIRESTLSSAKARYSQLTQASAGGQAESGDEPPKNDALTKVDDELRLKQAQLAVLHRKYTDQHPEVIDLKADLESLNAERKQLLARPGRTAPKKSLSLQNQEIIASAKADVDNAEAVLQALELDRVAKEKQQEKLGADLAGLQARYQSAPGNEQKYIALTGERSVAAQTYAELLHRRQLVLQGKKVTDNNAGEILELVDSASLPETPMAPNRWQMVGFGAMGGLVIGLALAGTKEMKDTSLKNLKDVRAYTNLAVLSCIPLLENAALAQKKRRVAYLAWTTATLLGVIGTAISLYYHSQAGGR